MTIVDGKALAQKMLPKTRIGLDGRHISIAAIWVGDPAQSTSADRHSERGRALGGAGNLAVGRFIEMKKKYAESIGVKLDIYHFENNVTEEEIINKISELSADGIIIELPLPEHLG